MSKIEKNIIKLIKPNKIKHFQIYNQKINSDAEKLKLRGVTDAFKINEFIENKNEILNYFKSHKVFYLEGKIKKYFSYNNNLDYELGYYDEDVTAKCPYVFDIINNDKIIKCLSNYFLSPFKLDYVTCWWSYKKKDNKISEKTRYFHRDIDNFNFIKLFLYLNDVDHDSGPHQYLLYSHKKIHEKKISTKVIRDEKLDQNKNIFIFTGTAGSAILANTFGIHRGLKPISNNRLMMVMSYSLINSSYCPNKPLLNQKDIKSNIKFSPVNEYIFSTYLKS